MAVALTAVVADDEPLARRKLAALISDAPGVSQVGEACDGNSALRLVESLHPDVLFLDIQMPELSGIGVVRRLQASDHPPVIVFTTAYDQYAVTAFELQAVDYLLKPFGAARFLTALERTRRVVETRAASGAIRRAHAALDSRAKVLSPDDRLFVRRREGIVPIPIASIRRIHAQDDYVMICADERESLVGLRMAELEASLPNPPFLRVHRSHMVNLDHVDRIVSLEGAHLEVRMKDGARIPVSRAKSREIRQASR